MASRAVNPRATAPSAARHRSRLRTVRVSEGSAPWLQLQDERVQKLHRLRHVHHPRWLESPGPILERDAVRLAAVLYPALQARRQRLECGLHLFGRELT